MGNKLYVGNLPYGVRDADLAQAFAVKLRKNQEKYSGGERHFRWLEWF